MIPHPLNPFGFEYNMPLTFTAVETESSVTLNAIGSPNTNGLKYRLGKSGNWLSYTPGTTVNLASGVSVQFWNFADTLSTSSSDYVQFVFTGQIKASGFVNSLLNMENTVPHHSFFSLFNGCSELIQAPKFTDASVGSYGYQAMFTGCGITSAPILPALSTANMAYSSMFRGCTSIIKASPIYTKTCGEYTFVSMFRDCSSLIHPPKFYLNRLAVYCFNDAFRGCTSLQEIPDLPLMTLYSYCYYGMFRGCTSITSAYLPANTLNSNCYRSMFEGASSLSRVEVNFTDWNADGTATANWLNDVSSIGTFTKPQALEEVRGGSRIPTSWTVVNK